MKKQEIKLTESLKSFDVNLSPAQVHKLNRNLTEPWVTKEVDWLYGPVRVIQSKKTQDKFKWKNFTEN